jgi:hypothetical protein
MSQYKISKKRLAEIIKEEYQTLNEDNALTRTINRWAEEAKNIPPHLTVARMMQAGDLDGAMETIQNMKDAQPPAPEDEAAANVDALPYNRTDEVNDESLDSIRVLIQQELKNL